MSRRKGDHHEVDEEDEMNDVVMVQGSRERRVSAWDVAPIDGAEWPQSVGDDGSVWPLFIEMSELTQNAGFGRQEWRETNRWIKFEEAVEKDSNRWSKPYVPSLTLPSIKTLRSLLEFNFVQLDTTNDSLRSIFGSTVDAWKANGSILESHRERILDTLLRRHVHLYERVKEYSFVDYVSPMNVKIKNRGGSRKGSIGGANPAAGGINRRPSSVNYSHRGDSQTDLSHKGKNKKNVNFMKKIPSGAEACNIMVGEVPGLDQPISAFLRITPNAKILGNITEVSVPTRFIFVVLAPVGQLTEYCEVGRAMGAIMSDPSFKTVAYKATKVDDLLMGLDNFADGVTVLPAAGWDSAIRIEPLAAAHEHAEEDPEEAEEVRKESGLTRSGRLFGGLIADIKRKLPWYPSDIRDALSPQCLATWLFLYFACLTPMITFGGILGQATEKYMGTMEVMVAGCICGVVFALFAGQPLLILGSTGPMLIFEKIVIQVCKSMDLQYLQFRLWIGLWICLILLILVATDASFFVSYITRFTEENFATLVACIFIVEAIKNVIHIKDLHPHMESSLQAAGYNVSDGVMARNFTDVLSGDEVNDDLYDSTPLTDSMARALEHVGGAAADTTNTESIFLMSILLFLGTFFISYMLKELRNSNFFPTFVRYLVSDFAVVLAIIIMASVDYMVGINTPKLEVPTKFAPTIPTRGWLVSPFGRNPFWTYFGAAVPALLATILIFMDQQITAVIINRKDHKLKKGCGYHLDLFILAILICLCSFLGLPWFIAATVESLTNVGSLKMESESAAPGEKPQFLGVREQRVSNFLIFTTVGLSVFITKFLQVVPMPVLYGVFLYMGFSALIKMELFERIKLVFMPTKYQPDHMYLRVVPTVKVHLYTLIQITSLALLWVIKSISVTAILFPLMLLVMMLVRKLLEYVFTQRELQALDDLLPGSNIQKKDVDEKLLENGNRKV